MSDEHVRELQRRFRASGSVEDEAAWLRARVQAGKLEQSSLELAAYCGYPAASESRSGSNAIETHMALHDWAWGLDRWGLGVASRCAVVGGRVAYRCLEARHPESGQALTPFSALLDSAETFIVNGGERSRIEQIRADWHTSEARAGRAHLGYAVAGEDDSHRALNALYVCANCTLRESTDERKTAPWHSGKVLIKLQHIAPEALHAMVVAEILPWVLRYSDPVRERVEARQRGG